MSGLKVRITSDKTKVQGAQNSTITFYDLSALSDAKYDSWWAIIDSTGSNLRVYDYLGARRNCGLPLYFSKASKRGILIFEGDVTTASNLFYDLVVGYDGTNAMTSVLTTAGVHIMLDTTVASGTITDLSSNAFNFVSTGDAGHIFYREVGPLGVSMAMSHGASRALSGEMASQSNTAFNFEWNQPFSFLMPYQHFAINDYDVMFRYMIGTAKRGVEFFHDPTGKVVLSVNNDASHIIDLVSNDGVVADTNWHMTGFSYSGNGLASACKLFYDAELSLFTQTGTITATILDPHPICLGYDTGTTAYGVNGWFEFPMLFNKQIFADQVVTLKNQMLSNSTFWSAGDVSNFSLTITTTDTPYKNDPFKNQTNKNKPIKNRSWK